MESSSTHQMAFCASTEELFSPVFLAVGLPHEGKTTLEKLMSYWILISSGSDVLDSTGCLHFWFFEYGRVCQTLALPTTMNIMKTARWTRKKVITNARPFGRLLSLPEILLQAAEFWSSKQMSYLMVLFFLCFGVSRFRCGQLMQPCQVCSANFEFFTPLFTHSN